MILKGYTSSLGMWSNSINKEAEDLITNLDNVVSKNLVN